MICTIRSETREDHAVIHALTEAAFREAPHSSHTEQFIVDALRSRGELSLSLVAEKDGQVVGHIALSPVTIAALIGAPVSGLAGAGHRCGADARGARRIA